MTAQGEIYLVDLGVPYGSEPGYLRPWVIVQNDLLNGSRLATVVVAAITSNVRRAAAPGNVLLQAGEAGLRRDSVVVGVSLSTFDRGRFGRPIGKLNPSKVREVVDAIAYVIEPRAIPTSHTGRS